LFIQVGPDGMYLYNTQYENYDDDDDDDDEDMEDEDDDDDNIYM
jgi:hypothetical protein